MKKWLKAFRLRTLPLALSSVVLATSIAIYLGSFQWIIFVLGSLTTILLQVLSNLANDYGDFVKGTDNDDRVGPTRSLQSGEITKELMKRAIFINVILAFTCGVLLVYFGTRNLAISYILFFIALGITAIAAAIKYTMGKGAYAYHGLGDVFVFLFFGIIGVNGMYFMFSNAFDFYALFLSIAVGCLSTVVLNLNNMRDIYNDKNSNKNTIVVRIGLSNAKKYHFALFFMVVLFYSLFCINTGNLWTVLGLLVFPVWIKHLIKVYKTKEPKEFDPELKKIALSTFLFSLLILVSSIL